jgi:ParB-like chromosome segregation protein Spo0J
MRSDPDDPFAALGVESPPQREGLPASYRMRNDHLVDHLTSRLALPLIRAVPIRDIDAPRPRETENLEDLVRSIEALGVLQPLFVRARSGRFELIAGAKRLAAAATAGLTEVPCLVYTCDEQRARAIAEAENLRATPPAPSIEPTDEPVLSSVALKELQHGFSTIESCLHLLVDRDASLRDRVALDLIRTEAHRARRLVQCLNTLDATPTLALAAQPLGVALDQALDAFGPERRLSGVQVRTEAREGLHVAAVDPEWFGVALSGLLGGLLTLVQNTRTPVVDAQLSTASSGSKVVLELSQTVVTLPDWAMSRFFDVEWTDRPGGYQAAVELAAAKRLIEQHRGEVTLVAGDRGGCRLVATVPAAR